MTGFTKDIEAAEAPEWAAAFDVGDDIRVQSESMDTPTAVTIIGWSTIGRNRGLPVCRPEDVNPCHSGYPNEIAIDKEDVVDGGTDE